MFGSHGLAVGKMASRVVRCVPVGPENTWEISIPLSSEASCMLAKDGLEGPVEPFYHPITLGMVGSCI